MPIYEYRCEECDEDFEVFVRSPSQKANFTCPKCGGDKANKVVSLFGVGGATSRTAAASCSPGST